MIPTWLASSASFSPYALFRAGETGVWYDPSDFSTMFTDDAGSTPVTATGQSVALILDKSKGLGRGSELVANGTFDSSVTGWTQGTSITAASVNGRAEVTRNGAISALSAFWCTTTVVSGNTYEISIDVVVNNGAARQIMNGAATAFTGLGAGGFSGTGTKKYIVTANDTGIRISLWTNDASTSVYDNISIKQVFTTPARQTTAGSRPTLQQDAGGRYYLSFDGVDDHLISTSVDMSATNKVTVTAGVQRTSDANVGVIIESSTTSVTNAGTFDLYTPNIAASTTSVFIGGGTTRPQSFIAGVAAPDTMVLTGISDIAAPNLQARRNTVAGTAVTTTQGTGNYGNWPFYIGSRAGLSAFFTGRLYNLIVRGALSTGSDLTNTETFVNKKTGAY